MRQEMYVDCFFPSPSKETLHLDLGLRLGQLGENQIRAFSLIGFLLFVQLVFGLLFGSNAEWVADIAGFGIGFALSIILVPGGWAKLVNRLRQRD